MDSIIAHKLFMVSKDFPRIEELYVVFLNKVCLRNFIGKLIFAECFRSAAQEV